MLSTRCSEYHTLSLRSFNGNEIKAGLYEATYLCYFNLQNDMLDIQMWMVANEDPTSEAVDYRVRK